MNDGPLKSVVVLGISVKVFVVKNAYQESEIIAWDQVT